MRIRELLESKDYKDLDAMFKPEGDEDDGIGYDLLEDLTFFMNNDDDAYRRHLYPALVKCIHLVNSKQKTNPSLFHEAVKESYKEYLKKFPKRELPDELDEKMFKEACEKLHEEIRDHITDGKYKD